MRVPAIAVVAVLSGAVALATATPQQTPPSSTQPFRASTDLTQVEVRVLDRSHRPVRGLKAPDFTIEEDGKPQPIAAFAAIDVPNPPPATAMWMKRAGPDIHTNLETDQRLVMILIDDATLGVDQVAVNTAKRVVRKTVENLGPSDLASVIFTLDNRRAQDFTTDHGKLLASVDGLGLSFPEAPGCGTAPAEALRTVAENLDRMPLRRKFLIFVSAGIDFDPLVETPAPGSPMMDAECALRRADLTRDAIRAAERANLPIYPIDPTGLTPETVRANDPAVFMNTPAGRKLEFLQTVAANTGGVATLNTNAPDDRVDEVFRENASYYLLGFRSTDRGRAGRFHRLSVKVNRPDVEVRARNGTYEPTAKETKQAVTSPLLTAISGVLPKSDLPLCATAAVFPVIGASKAPVGIVLGVRTQTSDVRVTETVELLANVYTNEGRLKDSKTQTARVVLRPVGRGSETGFEVLSRVDLAPGRYSLRLAASGTSRELLGSIYVDVDVPDLNKLPVALSDVAFAREPPMQSAPRDALQDLLPIVPTSVRDFVRTERVTAFARLYQGGKGPLQDLQVTTQILDRIDRSVWDQRQTLRATMFTSRTVDLDVTLPLERLPLGPYLLRIESGRLGATPVAREVPFTVIR